eukprot:TRINITY_DN75181_c0_g1_i1.p1 TRINITY_DN75181_c0_g1~~TRINITY_DN75181_c0_g1_i1.p1  ORF type:complete len:557 (-),score=30.29 TRINITY_DN75181_c0_g1_i1:68-1738(-)
MGIMDSYGLFERDKGLSLLSSAHRAPSPHLGNHTGRNNGVLPFQRARPSAPPDTPHAYDVKYSQIRSGVRGVVPFSSGTGREEDAIGAPMRLTPANMYFPSRKVIEKTLMPDLTIAKAGREAPIFWSGQPTLQVYDTMTNGHELTAAFPTDKAIQAKRTHGSVPFKKMTGRDQICFHGAILGGIQRPQTKEEERVEQETQQYEEEDDFLDALQKQLLEGKKAEEPLINRQATDVPLSTVWESPKQAAQRKRELKRKIKGIDMEAITSRNAPTFFHGKKDPVPDKATNPKFSLIDKPPTYGLTNFKKTTGRTEPKTHTDHQMAMEKLIKDFIRKEVKEEKKKGNPIPSHLRLRSDSMVASTIQSVGFPDIYLTTGRDTSDNLKWFLRSCDRFCTKKGKQRSSSPKQADEGNNIQHKHDTKSFIPTLVQPTGAESAATHHQAAVNTQHITQSVINMLGSGSMTSSPVLSRATSVSNLSAVRPHTNKDSARTHSLNTSAEGLELAAEEQNSNVSGTTPSVATKPASSQAKRKPINKSAFSFTPNPTRNVHTSGVGKFGL